MSNSVIQKGDRFKIATLAKSVNHLTKNKEYTCTKTEDRKVFFVDDIGRETRSYQSGLEKVEVHKYVNKKADAMKNSEFVVLDVHNDIVEVKWSEGAGSTEWPIDEFESKFERGVWKWSDNDDDILSLWADAFDSSANLKAIYFNILANKNSVLTSKFYDVVKESEAYTNCEKLFRKIMHSNPAPLAAMNAQLISKYKDVLIRKKVTLEIGSGRTEPLVSAVKEYNEELEGVLNQSEEKAAGYAYNYYCRNGWDNYDLSELHITTLKDLIKVSKCVSGRAVKILEIIKSKAAENCRKNFIKSVYINTVDTKNFLTRFGYKSDYFLDYQKYIWTYPNGTMVSTNTKPAENHKIQEIPNFEIHGDVLINGSISPPYTKHKEMWQHYDPQTETYSTQPEEDNIMSKTTNISVTVPTKAFAVVPAFEIFYGKKAEGMQEEELFELLLRIEEDQKVLKALGTGKASKRIAEQIQTLSDARKQVIKAIDALPEEGEDES